MMFTRPVLSWLTAGEARLRDVRCDDRRRSDADLNADQVHGVRRDRDCRGEDDQARPVLTVCDPEHGVAFGGRIVRSPVTSAVSRTVRLVARGTAFGGSVTLSITSGARAPMTRFEHHRELCSLPRPLRCAPSWRGPFRWLVRAVIGQWQNFAADVADDFDLLLHQTFDRQDFLTF